MSDPSAATPAGSSVIHDLGYRPYTGPRLGPGAIARALTVTGFRNAFGLGRSGKSKVLPFAMLQRQPSLGLRLMLPTNAQAVSSPASMSQSF